MLRASAVTFSLLAAVGSCDPAPAEPRRRLVQPADERAAAPTLAQATRRVAAAVDASIGEAHPLGVPAPAGSTVVAFTRDGMRHAALVDAERAWVGRDGAERALALWTAQGEVPDAIRLARLVGAMVYPGCAVMLGGEALALGDGGSVRGPAPAVSPHPGGGRVLTFTFAIPTGQPGAGLHVARLRWTDSGLLIEESPHPERR